MSWAAGDDEFDIDPDIDKHNIPAAALGLFWCSVTYCCRNRNGGFVPQAAVLRLPGGMDKKTVAKLVEAKWWVAEEGGYQIRSFLKYNPACTGGPISRKRAEAGSKGGKKAAENRRNGQLATDEIDSNDGSNMDSKHSSKSHSNDPSNEVAPRARVEARPRPLPPFPESPDPEEDKDTDSLGGGGASYRSRADAPAASPKHRGSSPPKEPHRAVVIFNERRTLLKGRPAAHNAQLEGRMIRLFTEHGEVAFVRALDGYFSGLNGSDPYPAQKGYDIATFVRQFDTWESGTPAALRSGSASQPSGGMSYQDRANRTLGWLQEDTKH